MNPGSSPSPSTGRTATAMRRVAVVFAAGVTAPPAPRPRWLMRGQVDLVWVVDVTVALICFAGTTSRLSNEHHYSAGISLLISLALCAPLAVRNYLPLTAWAASAIAMFLFGGGVAGNGPVPAGILVYLLCLYAVAVRCEAWVVTTAGVVTVVGAIFAEGLAPVTAILLAVATVL